MFIKNIAQKIPMLDIIPYKHSFNTLNISANFEVSPVILWIKTPVPYFSIVLFSNFKILFPNSNWILDELSLYISWEYLSIK